jgi:benzaldehyde dehydrogenase (NAD)
VSDGMSATTTGPLLGPARWQGRIFRDGWSAAAGVAAAVEPSTGETLGEVGLADAADVARACASAAAAQPAWAARPAADRGAIVRRAAEILHEARGELLEWLVRESGATRGKAAFELHGSQRSVIEGAVLASEPAGLLLPTGVPGRTSLAERRPIGVVGVIAPWNAPLVLALRSVAPALALGNAVVLKPDPRTAVCGGVAIARIFEAAGLPEGVLHVVPGGPDAGAALVADAHVGMVSFTGSTAVGREVGRVCGERLKRAALELGGNNAFVVLEGADVERASSAGAWSSFLHQGQICMCAGRHLVHRSIAEEYAEALARRAAALKVGDPWMVPDAQVGPIVDARQLARVRRIVADSVAAGARVLAGGGADGPFHEPTVLADVTPSMAAFAEEIFGPVAPVVAFDDEEEAVALADAGGFGLVASVCGGSEARARAVAERIRAGIVHVNDHTINSEVAAPFGGFGESGNGIAIGGPATIDQFTAWRWTTLREQIRETAF